MRSLVAYKQSCKHHSCTHSHFLGAYPVWNQRELSLLSDACRILRWRIREHAPSQLPCNGTPLDGDTQGRSSTIEDGGLEGGIARSRIELERRWINSPVPVSGWVELIIRRARLGLFERESQGVETE